MSSLELGDDDFLREVREKLHPAPRRGRPTLIDDARLEHRRDVLVTTLESGWGLVGWELQQATRFEHIRVALLPIAEFSSELAPFVRESSGEADARILRRLRSEIRAANQASRAAYEAQRAALDARDRASRACDQQKRSLVQLRAARGSRVEIRRLIGQLRSLKLEFARRQRAWETNSAEYQAAQDTVSALRQQVEIAEAAFCQSELLEFVLSRRYRLIPLNFANAMAGLPYMSWRQSFKRCGRVQRGIAESLSFEQFKLISFAVDRADGRSSDAILTALRTRLQSSTNERDFAISGLKENWYYLCRAVENTLRFTHAREEVQFRIAAAYQAYALSPTPLDILRAEEEKLK